MQPRPPFPSVVLAVSLKHGGPRIITSHMSKHHGECPETWQATCNNLSSCSNPRAVFNLLNTVAGKKGSSCDPEILNSQSPKDTANIYASYLRSHFSQQTPQLYRGAERSFMNDLRSDQCSDSFLYNTFCSLFTTKELATAISKLSTSTASGPDFIAYPLLTHLSPSAQQHLLFIFN